MSNLVSKGPCEKCNSSDANASYDDGHSFCFVCGTYSHPDGGTVASDVDRAADLIDVDAGEHRPIRARKITLSTCQFFNYTIGKRKGKQTQFAPYYTSNGELAGYHLKFMKRGKKGFSWILADGLKMEDLMPFGWQRFRHRGGRKIVVTEGEIDAMSFSQLQSHQYPVVSIPTGAGPQVQRYFAKMREWFNRFDEVILMFDNDEVGQSAAVDAALAIGAKARIADLPLKDPSEMLMQDEGEALLQAMWAAQPYRPAEIVTLASLREEMTKPVEYGLSYPYEKLTKLTYGARTGEIITIGAGVGAGKTDLEIELALHFANRHGEKVGMFMFEQEPRETGLRLAGKLAHKRFHIPNDPEVPKSSDWTTEQLHEALDELSKNDRIFLYNSFGANDWETVKEHIRFLRHSEGVKYFFIDHVTLMSEAFPNTREILEQMFAEMAGMVKELDALFFVVSHLATPESGPSHEEGGRVTARQFKGSRAIATYSHFMIGIERNQQAENPADRRLAVYRILKDRYTGQAGGETILMSYDPNTGLLYEVTAKEDGDMFTDTPELAELSGEGEELEVATAGEDEETF